MPIFYSATLILQSTTYSVTLKFALVRGVPSKSLNVCLGASLRHLTDAQIPNTPTKEICLLAPDFTTLPLLTTVNSRYFVLRDSS